VKIPKFKRREKKNRNLISETSHIKDEAKKEIEAQQLSNTL
jgi:hypothetical protein